MSLENGNKDTQDYLMIYFHDKKNTQLGIFIVCFDKTVTDGLVIRITTSCSTPVRGRKLLFLRFVPVYCGGFESGKRFGEVVLMSDRSGILRYVTYTTKIRKSNFS